MAPNGGASSEIRDTGCSSNILAANACTTAWIIAFRAVTRVQAYRLNLPARRYAETRLRPQLFTASMYFYLRHAVSNNWEYNKVGLFESTELRCFQIQR